MEYGSIERQLHIDASPEIVYDVVSSPEHIREWWPDHADFDTVVGGSGTITFGDPGDPAAKVESLTVVEADPPRRFAFRWVYDAAPVTESNSLLVTFELEPADAGTLVRFSEVGFRERGWDAAVLEAAYNDHVRGWNMFLPRLVDYADRLGARL